MIAGVKNNMVTETNQDTVLPAAEEFDNVSRKGWEFFTKFLFGNVVATVVTLVIVALLTVWR
jgi:hypothetical protein